MITPPFAIAGGLVGSLPRASTAAARVDAVFIALLVLSGVLVFGLAALNFYFLIRYRRGSPAPRGPLKLKSWKLEAAWITATTLVFLFFFVWGARLYLDMERPPADAAVIDVVARQWMWDVRHPNGRREFDTLHVPVGHAVRLRMTSEDVIHSFFIPAFRIKQDVVPGKVINTWFEPTRPGRYQLFCAQYCGTKHAGMTGEVIVQTPEDYAAWLAEGQRTDDTVINGRRLFVRYGCSGCHTAGSSIHAPPLEGIYGHRVPLADGTFVRVDETYLHDSIIEPAKQIAAGYAPVMPAFKGVMPEGDVLELVNYIKSLADPSAPANPPASSKP